MSIPSRFFYPKPKVQSGLIRLTRKEDAPKDGDILVEIGPGTGNLTKKLLTYPFKALHLLEIAPDMIRSLKENIKDPRVVIHEADAVGFDFCSLGENLKVFGKGIFSRQFYCASL